jgi:hypothetical protein
MKISADISIRVCPYLAFLHNFKINNISYLEFFAVAPHAGAWIEIFQQHWLPQPPNVAPHAGAWIEIPLTHKTR